MNLDFMQDVPPNRASKVTTVARRLALEFKEGRLPVLTAEDHLKITLGFIGNKIPYNSGSLVNPSHLANEILAGKDAREVRTGRYLQEVASELLRDRFPKYMTEVPGGIRYRGEPVQFDHILAKRHQGKTHYAFIEQKTNWNACNKAQMIAIEKTFDVIRRVLKEHLPDAVGHYVLAYSCGRHRNSRTSGGFHKVYGYDTWKLYTGLDNAHHLILDQILEILPNEVSYSESDHIGIRRCIEGLICNQEGKIDHHKWLDLNSPPKAPRKSLVAA